MDNLNDTQHVYIAQNSNLVQNVWFQGGSNPLASIDILFGLYTFLVPIAVVSKLFRYQACGVFIIFVSGNFVAMNKPFDANLQFQQLILSDFLKPSQTLLGHE